LCDRFTTAVLPAAATAPSLRSTSFFFFSVSCLPAAAGAAGGRNASAGLDERLGGARRGEFVCRLGLAQAPVAV